jgi:hypothetical protein
MAKRHDWDMNEHVARILVFGGGIAAAIFFAWLAAGRKVVAQASADLPQTFVASRFAAMLILLFSLVGALSFSCASVAILFFQSEAWTRENWAFSLATGGFMILMAPLLWLGVRIFGTLVIWPDRLTLDHAGISGRIRGKPRRWSWDQIAGVRITSGRADMVSLGSQRAGPGSGTFSGASALGQENGCAHHTARQHVEADGATDQR